MKKVLILGGTQFIGRYLVEQLLKRSDIELTLFNRQQTNQHLFTDTKKIKGDRNTINNQSFTEFNYDLIVDLSCYYPDQLKQTLKYVPRSLSNYIFISTCSVYDNEIDQSELRDETATLLSCNEEEAKDSTAQTYGKRKVACEKILMNSSINYSILRPSIVYGPYDHTDRFYYWLYQLKTKETLLIPDHGIRQFAITYVGDLIESIIQVIDQNPTETIFNVVSDPRFSISKEIGMASKLLNKQPEFVNASAKLLRENKITEWRDMPLWIDGNYFSYSNKNILSNLNLKLEDYRISVEKTIAYHDTIGWNEPNYGLSEETRQKLIKLAKANS